MTTQEVKNWFETACHECAVEYVNQFDGGFFCEEDPVMQKIAMAIEEGIQDVSGWLADELYCDKDFMGDMIGDHVYGMDDEQKIVEQLSQDSHYADWANDFLERHQERLNPSFSVPAEGPDRLSLSKS